MIRWLRKLWRREVRTEPLVDQCEVCGRWLTAADRVVISKSFTDDAHLAGGQVFGGTGISATFCVDHALSIQERQMCDRDGHVWDTIRGPDGRPTSRDCRRCGKHITVVYVEVEE